MPSWNIHTAHVEKLLAECDAQALGIADANAFLFGNYVPDVYLGFMVPDVSFHIDYCLTHRAGVSNIPVPDADRFWDDYIYRRRPKSASCLSLTLGAWAHLVTDNAYNGAFREFLLTNEAPEGEELRKCKQADFDLFGHSLDISAMVTINDALLDAAWNFLAYRILPDDVEKAVNVANAIVRGNDALPDGAGYTLLNEEWMKGAFRACDERLSRWLQRWAREEADGRRVSAADLRQWVEAHDAG